MEQPNATQVGRNGRPTVVVLGAGFGGLAVVKSLKKAPVRTVLLDQNNYHLFSPLLYQVGTALLDASEIASPIRALLKRIKNSEFKLGRVEGVDLAGKVVRTDRGGVPYDYLVVATGSRTNFFGNKSLEEQSIGLKDLDDALSLRNRVLSLFESARWASETEDKKRLLRFVVVGAGSTGVEVAGALAELVRFNLRKDFKEMDFDDVEIVLLEASDKLLAPFHPSLQEAARKRLEKKGIKVLLNTAVKRVGAAEVELADGTVWPCGLVVWTAGVQGSEVGGMLGQTLARGNRVSVEPTLQLPGHPEVFVVGDLAAIEKSGAVLPMLAPVATQSGKRAAKNIRALLEGGQPEPFDYLDKGIMSTIGRNSAVVQMRRFHTEGFVGWLAWLFVHLLLIVSFRSQLSILLNWIWNYLLNERPARLIVSGGERGHEATLG